jgi:hypothetical protein
VPLQKNRGSFESGSTAMQPGMTARSVRPAFVVGRFLFVPGR